MGDAVAAQRIVAGPESASSTHASVGETSNLEHARHGGWRAGFFLLLPLAVMALCILWPLVFLIRLSTLDWDGLGPATYVGLDNYHRVFTDDRFWLAVQNNLKWSVASMIIPPLIGLLLAILLARTNIRGRGLFRVLYFVPQMVASTIVAVVWRWIYAPNGPANRALSWVGVEPGPLWLADADLALGAIFVAYTWVIFGFSMLIFETAIRAIQREQFEAARVDGANFFQETWHILLPGIRTAVVTVLIVTAIWSFQIFDLIQLTTKGGPGDATQVISIGIYSSTFTARQVGRGAAMAVVLLVSIVLLASLVAWRRSRVVAR